jgi:hypothetical protein
MENTDSKIIDKILKLLALGKDNPNENEAQEAILKAHAIMAEYGIDAIEAGSGESVSYSTEFCNHRGNRQFRKLLSYVIATNFRCKNYYHGGQVVFFGRSGDAKIAKEIFEYAYSFAYKESSRLSAKFRRKGRNTYGVIDSYAIGFISGLKEKLGEQSTALMIITPPDVKEKYSEMSKGWKMDRTRLSVSNSSAGNMAYNQGLTDGRTVMNGRRLESA